MTARVVQLLATVIARSEATKQSILPYIARWIASRSLSSGAHSRDPLARNDVVESRFKFHSSSPGLTGRSSIPETAVLEPGSRGVLDHPHARVMTASVWRSHCHFPNMTPPSRGMVCPRFASASVPREKREQGMPGARCTRGLVCKIVRRTAHEHTGSAETLRHPPRNGFTTYAVLSPATNSSCHRRCRLDGRSDPVGSVQSPTA